MRRDEYTIYSPGRIGNLTVPNRLVRSSTWDPSIIHSRQMTDDVLQLYRELALGGVGLIIAGGVPVIEQEMLDDPQLSYDFVEIEGFDRIAQVVHDAGTGCRVVAQLENGYLQAAPSAVASPFSQETSRPFSISEIQRIVACFVEGIVRMKAHGFDGVQLHAAHGGLLSRFLSPYTNRRTDEYGGSAKNRARIVREIVAGAGEQVGDFVIFIKMNCTDYVEGGIDLDTFPELAQEIERAGVDAIEVSGGMWDCLVRSEEELGFRPVPAPESHTRIHKPEKQSYFLKYAERLDLDIPVILVGGNKDVELLENIVRRQKADFIAMCRPLIHEPDLPNRWLEGRGSSSADCISCNSCIHAMIVHPGRPEPDVVSCVFKHNKQQHKMAQEWLSSWVQNAILPKEEQK